MAAMCIGGGLRLSCSSANAQDNPFTAGPSVYQGAFIYQEGGLTSSSDWTVVTNFETASGKRVSILNNFYNWDNGSGIAFPTQSMNDIRAHGSIPLLTWQPEGASSWPTYSCSNIINGNFDGFINSWAQSAQQWGHPFFLRFAHEMNGNWYPWCAGTNGNTAAQFIQMWQHVHNIFVSVGATNVTWVWCVNDEYTGSWPVTQLYPGDNYVDWISVDSYNRLINTWADFSNLTVQTLSDLTNIAPGKPIIIAETGCHQPTTMSEDKGQWFLDALTNYVPSMPRIKAWVYENSTNSNDGNDWRITVPTTATPDYAQGIGLAYYCTNGFSTISNCPIQPLLNDATTTDTMGPFVSIVSPSTDFVTDGSVVNFIATASDKSGVTQVQFSINGVTTYTDTSPPYQFSWTVPPSAGSTYTIVATAYDTFGNSSTSTIQLLNTGTEVTLLSSDAMGTTSFNTAGNWSNDQAPNSTNDYYVGPGLDLRTPTNSVAAAFAGNSLTLAGIFEFKQTNVVSVNNLFLTNGTIVNSFAGGPSTNDMGILGGTMNVITNGIIDTGGDVGAITAMLIQSVVSGNGGLTIERSNVVTLTATNTYNGPVTVAGSTLQIGGTGSLTPSSLVLENGVYVGSETNSAATNIVLAGASLNVGYGPWGLLRVGYRTNNTLGIVGCSAVLDVSAQQQFNVNVGEFSVGNNTINNDNYTTAGSVYMATNNSVTATNIFIGDSADSGAAATSMILLGSGNNYFSTPVLTVGMRKVTGQLTLPPGGIFRLDNAGGPASLNVGSQNFGTSVTDTGTMDMSGGTFLANIGTLTVGMKAGGNSGGATGTLNIGASSANNITAGSMLIGSLAGAGSGSPVAQGAMSMGGGSFVVSGNVTLGSFDNGLGSSSGTLNLNGGMFAVGGYILNGGGSATMNVSGGTLVLSNTAGSAALPLTALNLTNAALDLNINGKYTNFVAAAVNAAGTTGITIESISNESVPATNALVSYTGSDPFTHLSLAGMPAGYSGSLIDNKSAQRIDLSVVVPPPSPSIPLPIVAGTNLTFQITNSQSGYNYELEATPRLAPASWTVVQTNAGGGTLNFRVPIVYTNTQQFFRFLVQ